MFNSDFLKRMLSSINRRRAAKPDKPAEPPLSVTPLNPKRRFDIGKRVGFSVAGNHIAMATARHMGRTGRLLDTRWVTIPKEIEQAGEQRAFVFDTVRDYAKRMGGEASIAISGWETAFRTFVMPALGRKELASAVQYETRKQLPFPADDCVYDFRRIVRIESDGTTKYRVALQAVTHSLIAKQLEPFRSQGIAVANAYHTPEVMGELLPRLAGFNRDQSYILVELTQDRSITSFYLGASLVFSFIGSIGLDQIADDPTGDDYDAFAESLIDELQASQDYYGGQRTHAPTNVVYLYGALEPTSTLLQHLNGRSNLEFQWFPVEQVEGAGDRPKGTTAIPLACLPAVAATLNRAKLANLLPREDRVELRDRHRTRITRAATILFVICLGLTYAFAHARQSNTRVCVDRMELDLVALKESAAFRKYQIVKRQITADQTYLDMARREPCYFHLGLKELSRLSSPGVVLDQFQFIPTEDEEPELHLLGKVTSIKVPPEVLLAEYVEALRTSKLFENVVVKRHVKRKVADQFELEFTIGMDGTAS